MNPGCGLTKWSALTRVSLFSSNRCQSWSSSPTKKPRRRRLLGVRAEPTSEVTRVEPIRFIDADRGTCGKAACALGSPYTELVTFPVVDCLVAVGGQLAEDLAGAGRRRVAAGAAV